MVRTNMNAVNEESFAEKIWLDYFNTYLFSNGIIDKDEFEKMSIKISDRYRSLNNDDN